MLWNRLGETLQLLDMERGLAGNGGRADGCGYSDRGYALGGAAEFDVFNIGVPDSIGAQGKGEGVAGNGLAALGNLYRERAGAGGGGGGKRGDNLSGGLHADHLKRKGNDEAACRQAGTWGIASAAETRPGRRGAAEREFSSSL